MPHDRRDQAGEQPDEQQLDKARELIDEAKEAAEEDRRAATEQEGRDVLPSNPPAHETGASPT